MVTIMSSGYHGYYNIPYISNVKEGRKGEKTTQLLLKLRKSCIYSELSSHKEKSFSSCKSHFEIWTVLISNCCFCCPRQHMVRVLGFPLSQLLSLAAILMNMHCRKLMWSYSKPWKLNFCLRLKKKSQFIWKSEKKSQALRLGLWGYLTSEIQEKQGMAWFWYFKDIKGYGWEEIRMAVCYSLFEDKLYTLYNLLLKAVRFQKQLMFMGCSVLVTAQLKTAKRSW